MGGCGGAEAETDGGYKRGRGWYRQHISLKRKWTSATQNKTSFIPNKKASNLSLSLSLSNRIPSVVQKMESFFLSFFLSPNI